MGAMGIYLVAVGTGGTADATARVGRMRMYE